MPRIYEIIFPATSSFELVSIPCRPGEELTSKILGINGHLKIKSSFGNVLKNDSDFSEKIVNVDKNLIIHKVVASQGLLNFKKYSSGVLIKGVTENFFLERNILTKSISKEFIQDFKRFNLL